MNRREVIKRSAILMGGALSAAALSGIMNGCKAEPKPDGWQAEFLNPAQYQTVADMAETILPKTDTPGAKDIGVPEFIDQMLQNYYDQEHRAAFASGLDEFMTSCKTSTGKSFSECTTEERHAQITKLEKEMLVEKEDTTPFQVYPFYTELKGLTLLGYFTSEKIGTEILRYDPIPGDYDPCLPYKSGDRAWSLG